MIEANFDDLPACLKPPDTFVGKSNNSIVVGYTKQHILAKIDRKTKARLFDRHKRALARVRFERKERQRIREELQQYSHSPDIVPPVDVVIHNGHNGDVAYSEVQEWYQGSRTLAEAGWGVFSTRLENLQDIRLIFATSLKHYRSTRDLYDVQGTVLELNPVRKIVEALIPLFSSTNILIDRDGHVRFVDADMLNGKGIPLRTHLHRQAKLIGARLSIGVLDVAILLNKSRSPREKALD
jgi:hypothetical protein